MSLSPRVVLALDVEHHSEGVKESRCRGPAGAGWLPQGGHEGRPYNRQSGGRS